MPVTSYDIMSKFRDNLRKLMEIYGLNQVELAKKAGVDQSLISQHLSGHPNVQTPSLKTLIALARALNVTLEELTGVESLRGAEEKMQNIRSTNPDLPEDIREIIKHYRQLSDEDKAKIQELVIMYAERAAKLKGGKKNKT